MAGIKLFDSFDCEGSVNHQIDGTRALSKASIVGLQKCRRHEGDIQYRHPDLRWSCWEEWKGCSWIVKWHSRYLHAHFQIFSQSCTVYLDRVSWIIQNSESFGHIWTFSRCTCWRSEAFRSFDVPAAAVSPRWAFASDVAGRPWQSCKRPPLQTDLSNSTAGIWDMCSDGNGTMDQLLHMPSLKSTASMLWLLCSESQPCQHGASFT